jgi:biopolymer transport protein ExbD
LPTQQALLDHVKEAAVKKPQPEIHIRADKDAKYEAVGRVMYAIQRGGVVKVGFITEPDHGVRGMR